MRRAVVLALDDLGERHEFASADEISDVFAQAERTVERRYGTADLMLAVDLADLRLGVRERGVSRRPAPR